MKGSENTDSNRRDDRYQFTEKQEVLRKTVTEKFSELFKKLADK